MQKPLSVTAINTQIKSILETTFIQSIVIGEISNLTYHGSGHIYFSIKDKNSSLKIVMFKGNRVGLRFTLEVGQNIECHGSITVYTPRGEYQMLCNKISLFGDGDLSIAYEQLKKKLLGLGYFDKENKKVLPKFVNTIAIVTSKTGAVIKDVINIINKRWPMVKVYLIDTKVQGKCKQEIISSIKKADNLKADVIILARGGGSMEDLWNFNEEEVAIAIYNTKTAIVSAIGHETDYPISDFVADLRAPTPSAAIELILPDSYEYKQYIDEQIDRFHNQFKNIITNKKTAILSIKQMFYQNSILKSINQGKAKAMDLSINFHRIYKSIINEKKPIIEFEIQMLNNKIKNVLQLKSQEIKLIKTELESKNPQNNIKKYFAKISKNGKPLMLSSLKIGDNITLEDINNRLLANITKIDR
jgi:exodeoxyribonuclease VII large subunit